MTKWLIYTVLFGAIPFIIRLSLYIVVPGLDANYIINEVDMVTFGLVLNISNINELDNNTTMNQLSKTKYIGASIFAIVIFSVLLGVAYVADLNKIDFLDKSRIKVCSASLSLVTLIFSYSIYNR